MDEDDRICDALKLDSLCLPDSPRIVKLEWDFYEDSLGEESIEIDVVFDRSTTDQQIEEGPIHAIKGKIMESLAEHGVTLFPYFTFMREDEYENSREEG